MNNPNELKVFISHRESVCSECKENLGTKAWVFLNPDKGALCLSCADLDHLYVLSPGNRALTIRAKKYSTLYAVILEWSRARKRYERQGILVEEAAIEKAEQECLNDADRREHRRIREMERREEIDQKFIQKFAERIRELYPGCPQGREFSIAEHACRKYSGRVGRSAAAKDFDEKAIRLAIIAHVRHTMTEYDELLIKGHDRFGARAVVSGNIEDIVREWNDS